MSVYLTVIVMDKWVEQLLNITFHNVLKYKIFRKNNFQNIAPKLTRTRLKNNNIQNKVYWGSV